MTPLFSPSGPLPGSEALRELLIPSEAKVLLLVLDGLGGLPGPERLTELEAARSPNLDALARRGTCGLLEPIGPGITPGSGPAHLALFGYDPRYHLIGRGALSALGVGLSLGPNDVAARANFCTLDGDGNVSDRRAGRISTEDCVRLTERLDRIPLPQAAVRVVPEREHRAVVVFTGDGLAPSVCDSDPQRTGVPPARIEATEPNGARMAEVAEAFLSEVRQRLAEEPRANGMLLRGFAKASKLPSFAETYGMHAAAIAVYPMYRGVAHACGMTVIETGPTVADQVAALESAAPEHDFVYLHVKATDTSGEDGDFDAKRAAIEAVDAELPRILDLAPSAMAVTGDHSTPSVLRSHSWHPVPLVTWGPSCLPDDVASFGERACAHGALGRMPAVHLMALLLGTAGRLARFGA
jgi:2,3-bisphosphoglycerate-independent phosphoglycerate mutase